MIRKTCFLNICFNDFNFSLTPTKTTFRFKLSMSQNKFYFDSFCNFFKLQTCVNLENILLFINLFPKKKNILLTIINNHVKHYKVTIFFCFYLALLLRNIFLKVKALDVNVIIILEFAFYIKSNVNV